MGASQTFRPHPFLQQRLQRQHKVVDDGQPWYVLLIEHAYQSQIVLSVFLQQPLSSGTRQAGVVVQHPAMHITLGIEYKMQASSVCIVLAADLSLHHDDQQKL